MTNCIPPNAKWVKIQTLHILAKNQKILFNHDESQYMMHSEKICIVLKKHKGYKSKTNKQKERVNKKYEKSTKGSLMKGWTIYMNIQFTQYIYIYGYIYIYIKLLYDTISIIIWWLLLVTIIITVIDCTITSFSPLSFSFSSYFSPIIFIVTQTNR